MLVIFAYVVDALALVWAAVLVGHLCVFIYNLSKAIYVKIKNWRKK